MSEAEQEQPSTSYVTLPIDWHVPEGLQSRYVNNVLVQPGQYEITLFFFETQFPPLAGSPEENKTYLLKQGSIRSECVGKMVVSPELVPQIIKALQETLQGQQESSAHEESETM